MQDAIEHRRGEHGVIGKGVISAAEGEIRVFFTGMRPSELVAVRVGSVNLHARTLQVERSRHLGSEAAPKTQRARRTVRLTRGNVEVLEPLLALKAKPHDYLFKNVWGQPIEPANFYDLFRDAQ